jgi:hypothetical protein
MCTARADDDAWSNTLHATIGVSELDNNAVCIGLYLGRIHASFDHAAERRKMGLKDSLRFVLRQAALELAAAVDVIVTHGAQLRHIGAIHSRTMNVLSRIDKRRQQPDGIQNLERAGLDRSSARLAVRLHVALDEPRFHAMAGKFSNGKQPGRAGADD